MTSSPRRAFRTASVLAPLALLVACGDIDTMVLPDAPHADATHGTDGTTPGRDSGSPPPADAASPLDATPPADAPVPPLDAVVPPPDATAPPRDSAVPPRDSATPPPDSSTPPADAGTGVWTEMLDAINAARAMARTCGSMSFRATGPLTWNARLAQAALGHSQTMARTSCFSHDGTGTTPCPDGTMCTRIVATGYRYSTIGENIAAGQPTVAAVMSAWLASPGHCANIMNPAFREVGAGMARGGSYGIYWTQNFGTSGGAGTCM